VSVTDELGVRRLFQQLADEFGGLDAVVNVAGITRPTSFAKGSDDDWLGVLSVHLDGYRNVLGAALPLMAAAGRVTSSESPPDRAGDRPTQPRTAAPSAPWPHSPGSWVERLPRAWW
jgi:NAD(P)-dependent dehydrogenase (short-subunit alcohol dehydrogenase family)